LTQKEQFGDDTGGFISGKCEMARLVSGFVAGMLACSLAGTTALAKDKVWVPVENKANYAVWDEPPKLGETVMWTGDCVDGKAQGKGVKT
jgi:hypothetical protein